MKNFDFLCIIMQVIEYSMGLRSILSDIYQAANKRNGHIELNVEELLKYSIIDRKCIPINLGSCLFIPFIHAKRYVFYITERRYLKSAHNYVNKIRGIKNSDLWKLLNKDNIIETNIHSSLTISISSLNFFDWQNYIRKNMFYLFELSIDIDEIVNESSIDNIISIIKILRNRCDGKIIFTSKLCSYFSVFINYLLKTNNDPLGIIFRNAIKLIKNKDIKYCEEFIKFIDKENRCILIKEIEGYSSEYKHIQKCLNTKELNSGDNNNNNNNSNSDNDSNSSSDNDSNGSSDNDD